MTNDFKIVVKHVACSCYSSFKKNVSVHILIIILKVHCATFHVENSHFLTHTRLNNRLMV